MITGHHLFSPKIKILYEDPEQELESISILRHPDPSRKFQRKNYDFYFTRKATTQDTDMTFFRVLFLHIMGFNIHTYSDAPRFHSEIQSIRLIGVSTLTDSQTTL